MQKDLKEALLDLVGTYRGNTPAVEIRQALNDVASLSDGWVSEESQEDATDGEGNGVDPAGPDNGNSAIPGG